MRSPNHTDRWLGLFCLGLSLAILAIWIPLDVETGLVEKVRRRLVIGDALGPALAGSVILLGALLTLLKPDAEAPRLKRSSLVWCLKLLALLVICGLLMRWVGPALTNLFTDDPYRTLRATRPWLYAGYLTGGTLLVAVLISMASGRFRWRNLALAGAAALCIALLYDLPFDDLILPPNGDV